MPVSTSLVLTVLLAYFLLLILVGFVTTRKVNSEMFFTANRNSPWYLVAFGMIGTTLSGVTFISIPGEVGNTHWTYLTLVFGNCVGYIVIALVLLPLFYRQNLVSIYSWVLSFLSCHNWWVRLSGYSWSSVCYNWLSLMP